MRLGRRLFAAVLIMIMTLSTAMTVYATGDTGQLTPEELAAQELQRVYDIPVQSNSYTNWPQGPGTYGEAAIVMEAGTGTILYAKNIDEHHYPASITKVLTALVALEKGHLDDTVTFSHDCVAFLRPGDSSIGLKEGNVISLEQALYATLLASANEGAYAVGENVGINAGHDYNWFLEQMNETCRELGGQNSNFVNTNGLHDPEHYTCARDMGLIGCEAFKHPEFFQIMQTMQYQIPATDTVEEHVFQQKHKMLRQSNANYYEYAVGGKTGFTSDALSTLITMADNGNMQLVCVVLRTLGKNIYPDTKNLFEYAFNNFTKIPVSGQEQSEDVEEILTDEGTDYVVVPNGMEFSALDMELIPDEDNHTMATLAYSYEGNPVGTARAALSKSYIKAHEVKKDVKIEKKDTKTSEKAGLTKKEKMIVGVLSAILVLLIFTFVVVVIRLNKKLRRLRQQRKKSNRRR